MVSVKRKGARVQNAKDSFYEALRERLSALNPERTVVVRGVTRPGLVVDENETQSIADSPDCFHLSWTAVQVAHDGALPLVSLECEVRYETAGTAMNGGLDRGRLLAAMDGELLSAVGQCPQRVVKANYAALAQGGQAQTMGSCVWWSEPKLGATEAKANRIKRTVAIQVMSFEEAGEL